MNTYASAVRQKSASLAVHAAVKGPNAGFCGRVVIGDRPTDIAVTIDTVIDGHSHIQSGATAPLPLIWDQQPVINYLRPSRRVMNFFAPFVVRGGKIQRMNTEEIADALAEDIEKAYGNTCALREATAYGKCQRFFTPVIIMTMDMDYAHIAGFPPESSTIYHEGKFEKLVGAGQNMSRITVDGVYYYDRKDALAPEDEGYPFDVTHERPGRAWVYQCYYHQHLSTQASVRRHPWTLIPMFHYDPRRWRNASGGRMDSRGWLQGPWEEPFRHIATPRNAGMYIGFKMYPPLGYKPLDPRLPHLEYFYSRCEAQGIPILTHCSPGGMTTHEADLYYRYDRKNLACELNGNSRRLSYDPATPEGYFFDEYVHPKNWRTVLERYPRLRLCLAHFGGDEWRGDGVDSDWVREIVELTAEYPNVYTDMSCQDLGDAAVLGNVKILLRRIVCDSGYRHLREKMIFGVDWYLSLITRAPAYREYVESFFRSMGEADPWLWYRISLVNPATFYRLDNRLLLSNMHSGLREGLAHREKAEAGYARVLRIAGQVAQIRQNLDKSKTTG